MLVTVIHNLMKADSIIQTSTTTKQVNEKVLEKWT